MASIFEAASSSRGMGGKRVAPSSTSCDLFAEDRNNQTIKGLSIEKGIKTEACISVGDCLVAFCHGSILSSPLANPLFTLPKPHYQL